MAQANVTREQGGDTLRVSGAGKIILEDSCELEFGTGSDVVIIWDGTGLVVTGLPTSSAGLAAGSIWSNSGVLTITS